jgi:hypothetical protein
VCFPNLFVVRHQVLFREAFAECVVNPVLEVVDRARGVLDEVVEAIVDVLFVQHSDAVLERILYESAFEPDGSLSI